MSVELYIDAGGSAKGVNNTSQTTSGDKKVKKTTNSGVSYSSSSTFENELQTLEFEEDVKKDPAALAAEKRAQKIAQREQEQNTGVKVSVEGNLITKLYPDGKKVVLTVSETGGITEQVTTTGTGENEKVTTLKFDENGKKIACTSILGTGENQIVTVYDYEDGKKVGKTTTGLSNGKECTVKCEYNADEKIIEKTITTGKDDNEEIKTIDYSYNANGELEEKFVEYPDGRAQVFSYSDYETDENGNTTRIVTVSIEDSEGNEIKTINAMQTLNDKGELLSSSRYDDDGEKVETLHKEFDKNGELSKKEYKYFSPDGYERVVTYTNFKQRGGKTTCDVKIVIKDDKGNVVSKETQKWTRFFDGTEKFETSKGDREKPLDDLDDNDNVKEV